MENIRCDWCKRETNNWIKAFDGRKICNEKDPGKREKDNGRFQSECWLIGNKISHSVKENR